jgi:carbonic anhydrase/acetyltransferase-like protein (isoleucine patch superfamily)
MANWQSMPCFIAPNPPTSFNPKSVFPQISKTAFIAPFSSIIGDVTIEDHVFVAPNVSIRADEGAPFWIGANTNIQDGVILHGLRDQHIQGFSIFIGSNVSIAHGALVHGPCFIENDVFVGFKAIVFHAIVGTGSYISAGAIVTNGVTIPPHRFVPTGALIDSEAAINQLETVSEDRAEFKKKVLQVNREFTGAYTDLFGTRHCSCGI